MSLIWLYQLDAEEAKELKVSDIKIPMRLKFNHIAGIQQGERSVVNIAILDMSLREKRCYHDAGQ